MYELPALSAFLTIVVAVWTESYKRNVRSPNPLHAKDAIMAFEFSRTAQQINGIFVDQTQKPAIPFIEKVRFLTRLDFLFVLSYTLFTVSFAWGAVQVLPSTCTCLALLIAPLIGLFDVVENLQLFQILNAVEKNVNATFQPALRRLSMFTWIKWQGTGLLMTLLIPFLWEQPDCWSRVVIVFAGWVFVQGLIAFRERVSSGMAMVQAKRFAGAVLITFLVFAVYAIYRYFSAYSPH